MNFLIFNLKPVTKHKWIDNLLLELINPAFAAAYGNVLSDKGNFPGIEVMWMITPLLRSTICAKNPLSKRTAASKFVLIVVSQSLSVNTAKQAAFISETPGLFARISSLPFSVGAA